MVYKLFLYITLIASFQAVAQPVNLQFDAVPLTEFSKAVYTDIMQSGYVIEEGLTDKKISLFANNIDDKKLPKILNDLLLPHGLHSEFNNGIYHIKKLTDSNQPYIYKPKYRTVQYLARLFKQAFPTINTNKEQQNSIPTNIQDDTGANQFAGNHDYDYFIAQAPKNKHKSIDEFLNTIDKKNTTLSIVGASYEVRTEKTTNSAIQILGEILGTVGINITGAITQGAATFNLSTMGLTAVLSLLDTDSRFKGISKPSLLVDSGETATFNAGQDVPVLTNTTIAQGQINQGVQYLNSGALLNVRPIVFDDVIQLKIKQEFSNFTRNQLSNIQSPLLNKRLIDTTLSLKEGDIIVLAGLIEERKGRNNQSLGSMPISNSTENAKLETSLS